MKTAAAYIRVSDERQTEYSPASQSKLVLKYAQEHGYYVPKEYIFQDDGISAKSSQKRTEFNRMIAMAKDKSHPFDAILVWKFSRFARNQEESIVFKSLLARNGVSVISISEPIIDGPFGSLIERIIEWFDAFYLINLSAEVKRGMTEKASRGEPMCRPAFGYDLVDKCYLPNKDAEIVKDIFESFLSGEGLRAIAKRLAKNGVKTYRGNSPDSRFIEYILNNPVYIGKIRWSTEGRAASKRDYDNPNIIIADGSHEPIITMETWKKTQDKLKLQKEAYRKHQRKEQPVEWMLKGLVRCSNCASTLTYQSLACPSMQCYKYARGGECRVSHSLSVNKANKSVQKYLKEEADELNFNISPKKKNPKNTVNYDELIRKEKKKLERFKEAYINEIDTLSEYAENKKITQERIQNLITEKEAYCNNELVNKYNYADKVIGVSEAIKDSTATEKAKNEILRSIIAYIVYKKKDNCLEIFFYT